MSTTSLFVELLIVGLGGLAWYFFLIVIIYSPSPIIFLFSDPSLNAGLITLLAVGIAYAIGVVLDRAYVPLWSWIDDKIRQETYPELDSYQIAQVTIAHNNSERVMQHLDFYRSRIRILRASMINFIFIAIFGTCALWNEPKVPLFLFISASLVSALCYFGFKQLSEQLYKKVAAAENSISK